jgi:polysaccharide export outer membrane protein
MRFEPGIASEEDLVFGLLFKKKWLVEKNVKATWAVACALSISGILFPNGSGFAEENSRMKLQKAPGQGKYPSSTIGTSNPVVVAEAWPASTATLPSGNAKTKAEDYSGGPKYLIGPEDVLHISVWRDNELTLSVTVRPDGKISLPLIQDIQAEGLTASELSAVIHQKLLLFINEPQVSVIVTQVNAPKVFVLGNVLKPGSYPLRSDMSVLQTLSLAGGFTTFASPKNIKVIRTIKGKQEIRKVNYYDIIDNGAGNYLLKPGDMIVVP